MNPANEDVRGRADLAEVVRLVLFYQAMIAALVAAVFVFVSGLQFGVAAFYGGSVALFLTWLRKRGIARVIKSDPGKSMLRLYLGMAQRFLCVLALFALALAVLKLDPLASIIGFGLSQLGYVLSRVSQKGAIS